MKRNMDLVERVLEWVEEIGGALNDASESIEQYSEEEVSYHAELCERSGFIEKYMIDPGRSGTRLTWNGHNLLEGLRDPSLVL